MKDQQAPVNTSIDTVRRWTLMHRGGGACIHSKTVHMCLRLVRDQITYPSKKKKGKKYKNKPRNENRPKWEEQTTAEGT